MSLINQFFLSSEYVSPFVTSSYDLGLVVLSLVIAVFTSAMALQMAHIARIAENPTHRQIAILSGTIALGGGIWSMHFIGMLAFELCTPVIYDPPITLLSMLPSLGASWVALQLLSQKKINNLQLVFGGLLIALGIAVMHYSGMSAMRMNASLRYEPYTFFASILIAIIFATLALAVRLKMRRAHLSQRVRITVSALLMGIAIAGLHYMGMWSARFVGQDSEMNDVVMLNTVSASLLLAIFTIFITVLVLAGNRLLRYRLLYRQLESKESRMRATLDTSADAILTLDSKGQIISVNHACERLFGWPSNSLLGENLQRLLSEHDFTHHQLHIQRYLKNHDKQQLNKNREVTGLHRTGNPIPMRMFTGLIPISEATIFVVILSDISNYKEMANSLLQALKQAEDEAQKKTLFLANISHELRTPLNAILGFSEMLLKTENNKPTLHHLQIIYDSGQSLLSLLNDILDTTKLERGSFTLEQVSFSLKHLSQQVYASMRLIAESKGLSLNMTLDPTLADYYFGDPLRTQQILNNLLSNAIKFTETGSVDLNISRQSTQVRIVIKDTGIGMTEEQKKRIFLPFMQADSSISRRFGGTGLGVTIVRQLIDAMQGELHVHSTPGQGSEFIVLLPLPISNKVEDRSTESLPEMPALHIMVVDDLPMNLELMQLRLEELGHTVSCASSGAEALTLLKQQTPDLVLMGVHMPDIDGLEATRRWREHERELALKPIPIIALSASVMLADQRAALDAGMNGFTSKPLDMHRLYLEISRLITQHEQGIVIPQLTELYSDYDLNAPINWSKGMALWGTAERLERAIKTFLREMDHRHSLVEAYSQQPNWNTLIDSLHRIAGATANLGLEHISSHAQQVEQRLRQGDTRQSRSLIAQLQQQLNQISLLFPDSNSNEKGAYTHSKVSLAEAQAAIVELNQCLQRHELNQQALDLVHYYLHQNHLYTYGSALHHALDDFNFEQASSLLIRLLAQIDVGSPPTDVEA